jgi:hypothetical protein
MLGIAQRYADDNAPDGASEVAEICGRLPAGQPDVLPSCSEDPANLTACLGDPPPGDPYVEVRLHTQMADGSLVLPSVFAQSMAQGFDGVSVGACARATWEPEGLHILAVSATICQFNEATAVGTEFDDIADPPANDHVIQFWTGSVDQCDVDVEPEWTDPNQAGFLDEAGGNCEIQVTNDGVVNGSFFGFEPYVLAPPRCEARVRQAWNTHEVIYLPIHDGRSDDENSPQFRHVFVAPFVVTGFQFGAPASAEPEENADPPYDAEDHRLRSWLTGRHPCDELRYRCLSGLFVGEPIPIASLTLDSVVRLIG